MLPYVRVLHLTDLTSDNLMEWFTRSNTHAVTQTHCRGLSNGRTRNISLPGPLEIRRRTHCMTGATGPLVLTRREGPILVVTLNRPEKLNALHPDLVSQLSLLLADAEGASDLNVLVVTGAGRAFSAGLDLELLLRWNHQEKADYLASVLRIFHRIWEMPQPVVAAVNGPAIAGGFDLAAFCDIRLAGKGAVFGQAEINLGLVQVIHPLYKSIGLARAKELAMTGESISAEEAYR